MGLIILDNSEINEVSNVSKFQYLNQIDTSIWRMGGGGTKGDFGRIIFR